MVEIYFRFRRGRFRPVETCATDRKGWTKASSIKGWVDVHSLRRPCRFGWSPSNLQSIIESLILLKYKLDDWAERQSDRTLLSKSVFVTPARAPTTGEVESRSRESQIVAVAMSYTWQLLQATNSCPKGVAPGRRPGLRLHASLTTWV